MTDELGSFEKKLLGEISALNQRILALEQERKTLERLLVRSRRENAAATEVARLSSGSRILVEQSVLNYLKELNGRSAATYELKRVAEGIELKIKESTFRSHLHRLKLRNLIKSAGHGRWSIVS
ncbi:hypothetical protein [Sphingomonas sp. 37zxx]|uniref:hypothetical protein n=1 Tax=Sphingomonas sp. 37zxx TaxID=1550073 RepID=UPI0012DFFDD4|nr:hypothetical protein [Sphingomonas sp. 37zxx]